MALAGGALLFGVGGYTAKRDLWPWQWMRQAKQAHLGFAYGDFGRLTGKPDAKAIDCPEQNARTAVFLIAGQSNAGNYAGQPMASAHGARVVNFLDGRCYIAASPLLGSGGTWGEYWTETANLLIASGHFDRIVLVPAAVAGSPIDQWAAGGKLNRMLLRTAARVASANMRVTHVLWHQGEEDAASGMPEADYRAHFRSLLGSLRGAGVAAPVYASVTTKCLLTGPYTENGPVARAQGGLPGMEAGVRAGVDSDRLLANVDRFDGCHLSGSGTVKMARAWAQLIGSSR